MRHIPRTFFLLLLLALSPLRADAAFILPGDAVLDVREFTFPVTPATSPERNLPATFHAQTLYALQHAGLTVLRAQDAPPVGHQDAPSDGHIQDVPSGGHDQAREAAPLTVTPLTDDGDSQTGEAVTEEQMTEGEKASGDEDTGEEGNTAAGEEKAETPEEQSPRATAATYILEGDVTLFRETVGTPTRIAGTIRIRAESLIHCTYRVKDASTGKVLISNVTSGSSARIASQEQELDAVLATLSNKAMIDAATKMAALLAGTESGGGMSDRSYYQDSPGKRLKPGK